MSELIDIATRAEARGLHSPPLIVLEALEPYVPGAGPIVASRLGAGHSNETFLVRRDGVAWVLRRPPRPPVPPSAHDVVREHAVLSALAGGGARVPRPQALCVDLEPIGAPFFVMQHVEGVVIRDELPPAYDNPAGRRQVVDELVDALVEIHAFPWRGTALERLGRPTGYLERQLQRWASQWTHNRTRMLPSVERVGTWLSEHRPETAGTTLVHGDYKLDNAMFSARTPQLLSVVDWELATLGDPLADLGFLCATHLEPGDRPDPVLAFSQATVGPGGRTRDDIVDRYARRSGRDVTQLRWYEVLALWKLAILLEGSYRRYLDGATDDPFFALLADGVPRLAERAEDLIRTES
jgi:aminoglycoside phosphotransferase (APT) family kinase protein